MRPRNFKGGRCTKKKLKKYEEIARTYDKIQTKYAEILDTDENIKLLIWFFVIGYKRKIILYYCWLYMLNVV